MAELSPIIEVKNVSKFFRLPHERISSVKSHVLGLFRRQSFETQKALQDVSFEIKPGEFFGIVGRNGSGKSTLLKMLAGIYMPTRGEIVINGRLTPFIELGVGFSPELTGRENVFLNGALLGFTRKEMDALYEDIVAFAELERFMDQKLKNYSSGMQVRLAFSIAIRARSDILLIDEVLAVGDLDFQKKCYSYFFDLKKRGQTVVLVSHDMSAIRKFCTKAALIHNSKVRKIGTPGEIADLYEDLNLKVAEQRIEIQNKDQKEVVKKRDGTGKATIESVETYDPKTGKARDSFTAKESIGVRMVCAAHDEIQKPALGFIFQDQADITVFATNTVDRKVTTRRVKKGERIVLEAVVDNVFTDGEYTITAAIEGEGFIEVYDRIKYLHTFIIGGHSLAHAKVHPGHELEISYQ